MIWIIFSLVLSVVYIGLTIKNYRKKQRLLESIDLTKYTKVDKSNKSLWFNAVIFGFAIAGLIIGIKNNLYDNIGLGIMLLFLSLAEYVNSKISNVFYYNDSNIIVNSSNIRLKSIKEIKKTSVLFKKNYEIHTINGNVEIASKYVVEKLDELLKSKKNSNKTSK